MQIFITISRVIFCDAGIYYDIHNFTLTHAVCMYLLHFVVRNMHMIWRPCVDVSWGEVERESGVQLMHRHGSLEVARKATPGFETLKNCACAMQQQNIPSVKISSSVCVQAILIFHMAIAKSTIRQA